MSHFYAAIDQSARKTEATARGYVSTGISTYAASWNGRIRTTLWHDNDAGVDRYRVEQEPHHGAGISHIIAEGVVGQE